MGPLIKRLYVRLALAGRNRRRNMEACLNDMTVRMQVRRRTAYPAPYQRQGDRK